MASITLSHPSKKIQASIALTGSKSESNRALILQALSQGLVSVENLSEAADTQTLLHIVNTQFNTQNPQYIDVGQAGTAMRFLTALLATQLGEFTLTKPWLKACKIRALLLSLLEPVSAILVCIFLLGWESIMEAMFSCLLFLGSLFPFACGLIRCV